MTELNANLGVDLNEGLKLWANVGAELGKTTKRLADANERIWNKLQFGTPVIKREAKAGVYPATGNLIIDIGKPELGTYWDVESVAVGGTDFNVTAAGQAGLYVYGANNGVSPGMINGVDYAATLPNTGFYGFRDIVLNYGDRLIVVIFNGTPGQTYAVSATSTVYNVAGALGDQINVGS